MDNVKKQNIDFWTINAPGIDNKVTRDMACTSDFYKTVDEIRYKQEPYLRGFFDEILRPGLVSLEVGCGLGSDLRTFSRAGVKVTGLDYSPENAYISKVGLELNNLGGTVISGDAESLPFPDESFDLVYSWGCLHHTPNTQKAIDELFRVLRPGGIAVVMLYHKGYPFWYIVSCYILGFKWIHTYLQDYINLKYDQTPLSQMFSRGQLYKLFYNFHEVDIRVVTYGGIQNHPLLKYIWKIFQKTTWLMRKWGSFAVIFARKPGNSPYVKESPQQYCSICHTPLNYQMNNIKCINQSCGQVYPIYKGSIPMLHPPAIQLYKDFLKENSDDKKSI